MAVTDLTGTKWRFNDTITATAGYGVFDLYAEDTEQGEVWSELHVGYQFSPMHQAFPPLANSVFWMPYIARPAGEFTITGGTDATNANLIAWLQANATQITEQPNTFSFGNLPIANMYFGTRQVKKVYLGNALVWEKETTLISFTIVGVSYQAEEGMTWQEWINSPYNIHGFIATADNYVRPTSGGSEVFYGNMQLVRLSDTIVANTAYSYQHSGGTPED